MIDDRSDPTMAPAWRALVPALVALVFATLAPATVLAQERFDRAREMAFAGQRPEARALLANLLEDSPEHWDARVLLGRLHAWDGDYEAARAQLLIVVRARPDYADARTALVDVELWSQQPQRAVELLREGLSREPTRPEFLYRMARAQWGTDDLDGAAVTLDRLLTVNPAHEEGRQLFRRLRLERARSKIGLFYGYTDVDDLSQPWHEASLQLNRRTGIGTVIARVNFANRFDQSTAQYEIDLYPRLLPGVYLYANYGYSPYELYPRHRYGAELHASVGGGVELSAGVRHLDFESTEVTIYTGSLSKYHGNWWFSLRPYVTPRSGGTSRSLQVTARRYFGNVDSYLDLVAGAGSSPGEITDSTDLARLDSQRLGLRGQAAIGDLFILKFSAGYSQEDLLFGRERRQLSAGLGFERRF